MKPITISTPSYLANIWRADALNTILSIDYRTGLYTKSLVFNIESMPPPHRRFFKQIELVTPKQLKELVPLNWRINGRVTVLDAQVNTVRYRGSCLVYNDELFIVPHNFPVPEKYYDGQKTVYIEIDHPSNLNSIRWLKRSLLSKSNVTIFTRFGADGLLHLNGRYIPVKAPWLRISKTVIR